MLYFCSGCFIMLLNLASWVTCWPIVQFPLRILIFYLSFEGCFNSIKHLFTIPANDCFPMRSSALRATRTMQSVRCSLFGHAILFNTVCTCTYSNNYVLTSGVAGGGKGGSFPPPRNPGKFAKDGEQPRPRPAIRINSSRKL